MHRILLSLFLILSLVFAPLAQATVAEQDSEDRYVANGVTVAFTYTFRILDDDDIAVYVNDTLQTKTTHYTVSGVAASGGGTVTFVTAPADTSKVTLIRRQPVSQLTNYIANSSYAPLTVMQDLDKNIMVDQMQNELLRRVPRFGVKSTYNGITIDDPVASQILRWKTDLSGIESVGVSTLASGTTATLNAGKVVFASSGTNLDTDSIFHWNNTDKRLGIGTATPENQLQIKGTQASVSVMNNAGSQAWSFGVNDSSSSRLQIGKGYGPGAAITPALTFNAADNTAIIGDPASAFGGMFTIVANNDWTFWTRRQGTGIGGTESLARLEHYSGGAVAPLNILTGISSRGTIASPTALQMGDPLLIIDGRGFDGSATDHGEYRTGISDTAAQIRLETAQIWTNTAHGSLIKFYTTPTGTITPLLRATLEQNGTLLLGTSVSTDSGEGDLILANDTGLRFVNAAGTSVANYGVHSDNQDNLNLIVPAATDSININFATNLRGLFQEENGGMGLRFIGESSADHSAPAANSAVLYLKDNGAGKTALCARFASGTAQCVATEP